MPRPFPGIARVVNSQRIPPGSGEIRRKIWKASAPIQMSWKEVPIRRELAIHQDVMNFMWVETPPGAQETRISLETPLENSIGQMAATLALAVLLSLIPVGYCRRFGARHPPFESPSTYFVKHPGAESEVSPAVEVNIPRGANGRRDGAGRRDAEWVFGKSNCG